MIYKVIGFLTLFCAFWITISIIMTWIDDEFKGLPADKLYATMCRVLVFMLITSGIFLLIAFGTYMLILE